jgi:hypothetical protein
MKTFTEIYYRLPDLLQRLKGAESYPIKDLTEGKIKKLMGQESNPIEGVYLITDHKKKKDLYVGRSRNLAVRIGTDLRAVSKEQATLSHKITTLKEAFPDINTIHEAREYMYNNYSVQMIRVPDVNERTIFQIYAAMELATIKEFNNFRET